VARKQRRARAERLTSRAPAAKGAAHTVRWRFEDLPEARFLDDVVAGLSRPQKALAPKYFYDALGSALFEAICRQPEYYATRAELALTRTHLEDIARFAGRGCELVEFGSGASVKTRLLIRRLHPAHYVAIDISEAALRLAAARLRREFPWLQMTAVVADFSHPIALPRAQARRVAYFPGSTIGNLLPQEAEAFLHMTRALVGRAGALLIGVDCKKDANRLHAAYNDAQGVTAAFNQNLLVRMNTELGADFDLRRFGHYAFYNASRGRVEMHLVSLARQRVAIGRHRFDFDAGETIHTENSHKYSVEEFRAFAADAGFEARKVWLDRRGLFSLHGLRAA
jgi:dimethylhistidine N-methyltransferase